MFEDIKRVSNEICRKLAIEYSCQMGKTPDNKHLSHNELFEKMKLIVGPLSEKYEISPSWGPSRAVQCCRMGRKSIL